MSRDEFEELTSENHAVTKKKMTVDKFFQQFNTCLLYTSDAADE